LNLEHILTLLTPTSWLFDEPLSKHTTFQTGGPADALALPASEYEAVALINALRQSDIRHMVIGNGSNLLFEDSGYRGVIVKIKDNMSDVSVTDNVITAEAGCSLSTSANLAMRNGLSGMELISGIPGSVGGAVYMNAGAYGSETKDVFLDGKVLYSDGTVVTLDNEAMDFGYRKSAVSDRGGVILSARFKLFFGRHENIIQLMTEYTRRRQEKQPLDKASAGSTFKRPEGFFAGKLIEDAGLRGFSIGGAQVSEKHCGFVINRGGAASTDIVRLIEHIQETVLKQFGVTLEPEVKLIEAARSNK
jgi:UDP-N-acetylmuramate dehydrogenase